MRTLIYHTAERTFCAVSLYDDVQIKIVQSPIASSDLCGAIQLTISRFVKCPCASMVHAELDSHAAEVLDAQPFAIGESAI